MRRVFFMGIDAAIAALAFVTFFLFLSRKYFHDRKRAVGYAAFSVYLCAMFAVVGLPDICYVRFHPNINLRPFAYMFSDFANSFLNVVLFVPLGFFLPLFWRTYRKLGSTVLFGLCLSTFIEVLQIFTLRATDVNDLLTNTFGSFVGWCFARLALRFVPGICPEESGGWLWIVCISTFLCMFFLHPFLEELVWFLIYQIAK